MWANRTTSVGDWFLGSGKITLGFRATAWDSIESYWEKGKGKASVGKSDGNISCCNKRWKKAGELPRRKKELRELETVSQKRRAFA